MPGSAHQSALQTLFNGEASVDPIEPQGLSGSLAPPITNH
jgi:hypothetical protein